MEPNPAFNNDEHDEFHFEGDNGKAAMLIHGFPGTPKEMRPTGEILNKLGYTVKGILLPGFGKDIENLSKHDQESWTAYIQQQVQDLAVDNSEIIIVGYSFGAALTIATLLKSEFPQVMEIVLFAPYWNALGGFNPIIRALGPLFWPLVRRASPDFKVFEKIDFEDPNQVHELEKTFEGMDLQDLEVQEFIRNISIPFSTIDELYRIGRYVKKNISKLAIPITIVQGTHDIVVPLQQTKKLLTRGQKISLQLIRDADHEFPKPDNQKHSEFRDLLESIIGVPVSSHH